LPSGRDFSTATQAGLAAAQATEAMESLLDLSKQQPAKFLLNSGDAAVKSEEHWLIRLRKRAAVNSYLQLFALLTLLTAGAALFVVVCR